MSFNARTAILALVMVTFSLAVEAHVLSPCAAAARAKMIPTRMIDELIQANANLAIRSTEDGPHYQPGWWSGGTIYLPFADRAPSQWTRSEWSNFYNELFSAWWGNVFLKDSRYQSDRQTLLSNPSLSAKYRRAHPRDPQLAQEEGYSETVATIIIYAYPNTDYDMDTGATSLVPTPYESLYYKLNRTVASVSHSDRPGYTPEAEDIYPDPREYNYIMRWLFGRNAPPVQPE